jgi:hypothetical protein
VKYILFAFFVAGAAPVTPEHHFAATAEFDDRATCEAVLDGLKKMSRPRATGFCAPKGAEGLKPDAREHFQKLWPPLAPETPQK